jgi:hypothetical protein
MIDITATKVIVPAVLFALLSPGMLVSVAPSLSLFKQTLAHALVLGALYWFLAKFILKMSLTRADLTVTMLLFLALTPGVLLTLPPMSGGVFMSGQTSMIAVALHTLVFAGVFALLRQRFSVYY